MRLQKSNSCRAKNDRGSRGVAKACLKNNEKGNIYFFFLFFFFTVTSRTEKQHRSSTHMQIFFRADMITFFLSFLQTGNDSFISRVAIMQISNCTDTDCCTSWDPPKPPSSSSSPRLPFCVSDVRIQFNWKFSTFPGQIYPAFIWLPRLAYQRQETDKILNQPLWLWIKFNPV